MDTFISVIIPVFNDPEGLEETLHALLAQDYPEERFEIIIADNGSTDSTFEKAQSFNRKYPGRIKIVQEDRITGSYAARNKAISHAKGTILCFIDANVIMSNDFIGAIDDHFNKNKVDYLGCNVRIISNYDTLTSKYQKVRAFKVKWYIENRKFAPTCCLAVKRSVIDRVGPFDSRLESGGDWEFGRRVHAAGYSQAFSEEITVFHPARWRFRDLVNKNKRCARGDAQLYYYFPDEFGEMRRKGFEFRKFLPEKPWEMTRKLDEREVESSFPSSLFLSCFHVPLNIIRLFSYRSELKRLRNQTK